VAGKKGQIRSVPGDEGESGEKRRMWLLGMEVGVDEGGNWAKTRLNKWASKYGKKDRGLTERFAAGGDHL